MAIECYLNEVIQKQELIVNLEHTLSIIKPDAVQGNHIGAIIHRFETNGLRVVAAKMMLLTESQAKAFYAIHKHRSFFQELVDFMISGPVFVMALQGENAVAKNREIMGATNPKEAKAGTIRADFADSIDKNAVHGSDSLENAVIELKFFFSDLEIHPNR
ncbi:MAG: nucleoside-diphosphate kinase [Rhabdochlamydiaceae bacterium]